MRGDEPAKELRHRVANGVVPACAGIICGDCNSADGTAKRLLNLPRNWSFSAEEIGQFVIVIPNGAIDKIDLEIAKAIYEAAIKNKIVASDQKHSGT